MSKEFTAELWSACNVCDKTSSLVRISTDKVRYGDPSITLAWVWGVQGLQGNVKRENGCWPCRPTTEHKRLLIIGVCERGVDLLGLASHCQKQPV
eukprot:2834101-Amphidinium_carterae.1